MSDKREIRLDIRRMPQARKSPEEFVWFLQATAPVRDIAAGVVAHPTRADALAEFQDFCRILGWDSEATVVLVRPLGDDPEG